MSARASAHTPIAAEGEILVSEPVIVSAAEHRHRVWASEVPPAEIPQIDTTDRTTESLTPDAWAALRRANVPERLFVRGASLTSIDTDENGVPMVRDVMAARLRLELGRCASWWRGAGRTAVQCDPPSSVVSNMLADPAPRLPPLRRLVNAPVFADDASIVQPGYHPSGTYYFNGDKLQVPPVSDTPSQQEVSIALDLIFKDLLVDFPLVDDAAKAHALSMMLLPFGRVFIKGPTPLHLIEKPSPGTGAGLLVTVATIPVLGKGAAVMTEGRDDDEWRKRLTAVLMGMPAVVLIDNLREPLDSAAVSSVLTSTEWNDRLLGQTKMVRVPVFCTWIATGNNPALSNEIARRCISIRLDPRQDRPWMRTGFRHENLTEWALEHRGQLVWACLTLVKRWLSVGRPQGKRVLGTFEEWARVMGGILSATGVPGFLGNLTAFYERADTEGESWRSLVEHWAEGFGTERVSVSTLINNLWDSAGQGPLLLRGATDRARLTFLGMALGKRAGQVFGAWCIERGGKPGGVQHWCLSRAKEVVP